MNGKKKEVKFASGGGLRKGIRPGEQKDPGLKTKPGAPGFDLFPNQPLLHPALPRRSTFPRSILKNSFDLCDGMTQGMSIEGVLPNSNHFPFAHGQSLGLSIVS